MTDDWRERPWIGFDLETTGREQESARIVTAAVVDPSDLSQSQTWLVNPGIPIPPESTAVHGITDEDVRSSGIDASEACNAIARTLESQWKKGALVVAYNAQYDFTVLSHELRRHNRDPLGLGPVLDPLVLWRALEKYRPGKKRLADAVDRFGLPANTREHEALADAVAALDVMRAVSDHEALIATDAWSVTDIVRLQQDWHRAWAKDFAAWFAQQGNDPSGIDPSWPIGRSAL